MKRFIFSVFAIISSLYSFTQTCSINAVDLGGGFFNFNVSTSISNPVIYWDFGDGGNGFQNNINYGYSGGAYEVQVTVSDSDYTVSCSALDTVIVPGSCGFHSLNLGLEVNFSSNDLYPDSVFWDFGDGNTSDQEWVSHEYASSGTYTICMTQYNTNSGGVTSCTICDTITVDTFVNCGASLEIENTYERTYEFNVNYSGTIDSILWLFGDGSATWYALNPSYTYYSDGTYYPSAIIYENGNQCLAQDTLVVDSNVNSCYFYSETYGLTATFDPLYINDEIIAWDYGDGNTDTTDFFGGSNNTYAAAGVYNVCMTLIDTVLGTTCTYCDSVRVDTFVNCGAVIDAQFVGGSSYQFDLIYSGTIDSVLWILSNSSGDFLEGSFLASPIFSLPIGDDYSVDAIIWESSNQCLASDTVYLDSSGYPCVADFISVEMGLTAFFVDISYGITAGTVSYLWDFGDGSSSTLQYPNHTYASTGIYNVCLTISDTSGCSDQKCISVDVDSVFNGGGPCQASFVPTQSSPFDLFLVNLSNGTNLSFNWDFGDGGTSSQAYPTYVYATTGEYNVCLTVSEPGGCSSTFCDSVKIDSLGNLYKNSSEVSITVISLNDLTLSANDKNMVDPQQINLFPNPADGKFNISYQGTAKMSTIRIIDMAGKQINQDACLFNQGVMELDVSAYSAGLYTVLLMFEDGNVVQKILSKK